MKLQLEIAHLTHKMTKTDPEAALGAYPPPPSHHRISGFEISCLIPVNFDCLIAYTFILAQFPIFNPFVLRFTYMLYRGALKQSPVPKHSTTTPFKITRLPPTTIKSNSAG